MTKDNQYVKVNGDNNAKSPSSWGRKVEEVMRNGWESVLKVVAFRKGLRVVEIGSAWGDDSLELQKLGATVMPVDINPEHIQSARKRGLHLARVGDMRSLPIGNGWADVAFSANALPLVDTNEDVAMAIREMIRVVKRGGLIVICTNYLTTTKQPYKELAYYQTVAGLPKIVRALGLRIKSIDAVHIPEKPWDLSHKYLVIRAKRT